MASPSSLLQYFFVLVSLLLMTINPSHSSLELKNADASHPHVVQPNKVNLSLYYETLCPACEGFIVNGLVDLFNSDALSIVNLHLVPYGNAHVESPNDTVICQHGSLECYFNTIEACALDLWPLKTSFPFIHCVENSLQRKQDKTVWVSCCKDLKLYPEPIKKCYESGHGKELILRNARETDRLKPPHQYVPWVTVDDNPIGDDYENYLKYVCDAYKGDPKPKACKIGTTSTEKMGSTHPVCNANAEQVYP